MIVDFSLFFQRINEQFRLMLIMLEREAVMRQIIVILVTLLIAWLVPRLMDALIKRMDRRPAQTVDAPIQAPLSQPGGRATSIRWLRAVEFMLFPALWLLLAQRSIYQFAENGWPHGLIDALMPVFWLLLTYRFVVGIVLAALPEERSRRFAAQVLRPVVWILILVIVRSILFSTLGIGEISLLRFADITIKLGDLINAVIAVLIAILAGWAARSVAIKLMLRSGAETDVANTVSNVTRYAVISLGVLIALGILGVDLSALAWIGGGLSVGLGFGLQELFGNFVSGIVLVFERIVRPGDIIDVQGMRGAVTKVAMRATVLKTADSTEIFVPNKELMTKPVHALTYSDRIARVKLDVGVAYDADLDLAERILLETIQRHPLIAAEPAPGVLVTSMDPYSIHYMGFGYVREFGDSFRVKSELYQMVRDAFQLHGIVIPFPRQDIVVASDSPLGMALAHKNAAIEQPK